MFAETREQRRQARNNRRRLPVRARSAQGSQESNVEPGTCAVETGPADRILEADAGPVEEDLGTCETEAEVKTISRFEAEAEVTSSPMTFVCQTGAEAKATSRFLADASPAVCLNNACGVVPAVSQLLVAPGEVQDEMTMACGVVPAVLQLLVAPAPWMTMLCNTCRKPVKRKKGSYTNKVVCEK